MKFACFTMRASGEIFWALSGSSVTVQILMLKKSYVYIYMI